MQKVWTVFKVIAFLLLALLFVKNTQAVTLNLFFGYSSTLPLFLWLSLVIILGIALGYFAARFQFWKWKRQHYQPINSIPSDNKEPLSTSTSPISSLADAFRAAPASPKGEDEHGHYGI